MHFIPNYNSTVLWITFHGFKLYKQIVNCRFYSSYKKYKFNTVELLKICFNHPIESICQITLSHISSFLRKNNVVYLKSHMKKNEE